jgi:hypothetical protein
MSQSEVISAGMTPRRRKMKYLDESRPGRPVDWRKPPGAQVNPADSANCNRPDLAGPHRLTVFRGVGLERRRFSMGLQGSLPGTDAYGSANPQIGRQHRPITGAMGIYRQLSKLLNYHSDGSPRSAARSQLPGGGRYAQKPPHSQSMSNGSRCSRLRHILPMLSPLARPVLACVNLHCLHCA